MSGGEARQHFGRFVGDSRGLSWCRVGRNVGSGANQSEANRPLGIDCVGPGANRGAYSAITYRGSLRARWGGVDSIRVACMRNLPLCAATGGVPNETTRAFGIGSCAVDVIEVLRNRPDRDGEYTPPRRTFPNYRWRSTRKVGIGPQAAPIVFQQNTNRQDLPIGCGRYEGTSVASSSPPRLGSLPPLG